MVVHLICAARPNFMKIAPLYHALYKEERLDPHIVHTGQHYDVNMSDAFFQDLGLPSPDIHLGVGSGTHAEQTGKVMMAYEKVIQDTQPDLIVVVGDVNSTVACTMAAVKISFKNGKEFKLNGEIIKRPIVAHLEAGLRSFDRSMPEEINRIVTDALADILWTPSLDANENLDKEGIPSHRVKMVGNIMIDSIEMLRDKIEKQNAFEEFGLTPKHYGLVTIHRPSNVDNAKTLETICDVLSNISKRIPLIFPLHPRTRKNMVKIGIIYKLERNRNLLLPEPINYIRFMNLVANAKLVITDSGGLQEETTYLGIPCLTLRQNTERPITVSLGTNQLCNLTSLEDKVEQILNGKPIKKNKIKYWDGNTAVRIVENLRKIAKEILV